MSNISKKAMKLTLEQYLVMRYLSFNGSSFVRDWTKNECIDIQAVANELEEQGIIYESYLARDKFYLTPKGSDLLKHYRFHLGI